MATAQVLEFLSSNLYKGGPISPQDFLSALWIAALTFVLYTVADRLATPLIGQYLNFPAQDGRKKAKAVFDNLWISCFSGILVLSAWYITLHENGGCTPWKTRDCLTDWPNMPITVFQRWYMVFMFGYYLFELFGTAIQFGVILKTDMVAHHIVTMALIVIAYFQNLVRMCCMWTALFDISNPLLHIAKTLNIINKPQLESVKWQFFGLFALSFFLARVVATPYSLLLPAFTVGLQVLPTGLAVGCQVLMVFIYILQLIWFYKIVQLATGKSKPDSKDD